MPGEAKWNLLTVKISQPCWDRAPPGERTKLRASDVYTTFGVGLWVAGVSPILLPYSMELKRPLEGSDGTLRPEDVVSPQRGEEDAEEAWNELWNAVEFIRLVLKHYSADSPQMKRAHWHLLPAIEQLTLPGALEAVRMTTKDACKLGFGGFCYEGPGYFWRRPMPQWAVSEFTKVMAEGWLAGWLAGNRLFIQQQRRGY